MIEKSGSYLACMECRRIFRKSDLKKQKKESDEKQLKCPFCGSTRFTNKFSNVLLCLDPEKSKIAQRIESEVTKRGIYTYFLE